MKNSALLKFRFCTAEISCFLHWSIGFKSEPVFKKKSGFKYVVSCNCIQIWNCFLEILIWDMLFPALFYLVMKVWIRIIFEILYFSLVLSLRCYLLMDIGVELEQWSSLLVPRRFCDQFARANCSGLRMTIFRKP